jgi:hypothetical protein
MSPKRGLGAHFVAELLAWTCADAAEAMVAVVRPQMKGLITDSYGEESKVNASAWGGAAWLEDGA